MTDTPTLAGLQATIDAILVPGAASDQAALVVLTSTMSQFATLLGGALARITELETEQTRLIAALFAAGLHVHPPS
jgi:hypothetical protein